MVYVDDSIMEKGKAATAGSKMLGNFISPFTSTVISRLGEDTGRVVLGEFGLEPPSEPLPAPMLCNDVFGHVRAAASRQGLCYIRPTYGTVSRFGLIPTACSMDQIGVVCGDPREGLSILAKIAGHDENDGAMFDAGQYFFEKAGGTPVISHSAPPYSDLHEIVFYILAYAEISGNLSRYDGVKFGRRAAGYRGLEELYVKSRSDGFGLPAKLAVIMGYMALSQDCYEKYYDKALRLRRLIKDSVCFDGFDIIALPADSVLPQLAGLPSLAFDDRQLMADVKNEAALLAAWEALQ